MNINSNSMLVVWSLVAQPLASVLLPAKSQEIWYFLNNICNIWVLVVMINSFAELSFIWVLFFLYKVWIQSSIISTKNIWLKLSFKRLRLPLSILQVSLVFCHSNIRRNIIFQRSFIKFLKYVFSLLQVFLVVFKI